MPKRKKQRNNKQKNNKCKQKSSKSNNPEPIPGISDTCYILDKMINNQKEENKTKFITDMDKLNDTKTNIKIETNPTKLYIYDRNTNIIEGPYIGTSEAYIDNEDNEEYKTYIDVRKLNENMSINIGDNNINEGICSQTYIDDIMIKNWIFRKRCTVEPIPPPYQLDVGEIPSKTESIDNIIETLNI